MKTLYQLSAKGTYCNFVDSVGKIQSRRVFWTKESAEAHIPEFVKKCWSNEGDMALYALDEDHVKVSILELEIET